MEVDGKEFLRNVNIEQDKARLIKEQDKLDSEKKKSIKKTPDYFEPEDDSAYVDIDLEASTSDTKDDEMQVNENILRDIMLEPETTNRNKKRYIILGFALIILFILTIVIIRVATNSDQEKIITQEAKQPQTIIKDQALDKIDSIIKEKELIVPKEPISLKTPEVKQETTQKAIKKEIILPEPIKEKPPVKIEPIKQKVKPKDLFEMKPKQKSVKKEVVKTKPVIKKNNLSQPKRKIVIPPPAETNFVKSDLSKRIDGYFIQVGAFSKKPTDKFLNNITKKGYRYTIHTVNIKGKSFNKVLIGPYPTSKIAKKDLTKIKKALNNKNAYVLKF